MQNKNIYLNKQIHRKLYYSNKDQYKLVFWACFAKRESLIDNHHTCIGVINLIPHGLLAFWYAEDPLPISKLTGIIAPWNSVSVCFSQSKHPRIDVEKISLRVKQNPNSTETTNFRSFWLTPWKFIY